MQVHLVFAVRDIFYFRLGGSSINVAVLATERGNPDYVHIAAEISSVVHAVFILPVAIPGFIAAVTISILLRNSLPDILRDAIKQS